MATGSAIRPAFTNPLQKRFTRPTLASKSSSTHKYWLRHTMRRRLPHQRCSSRLPSRWRHPSTQACLPSATHTACASSTRTQSSSKSASSSTLTRTKRLTSKQLPKLQPHQRQLPQRPSLPNQSRQRLRHPRSNKHLLRIQSRSRVLPHHPPLLRPSPPNSRHRQHPLPKQLQSPSSPRPHLEKNRSRRPLQHQ